MRKITRWGVVLVVNVLCLLLNVNPATASAKTVAQPGDAVKDGNYIYYVNRVCCVDDGMGIMRYNTKTGNKKSIVDWKLNGKKTNGLSDISVNGKYIYATWDVDYGQISGAFYVYRFTKNGKQKKRLAEGRNPVIIGQYIYYLETELVYKGEEAVTTGNIYRMKKDGASKKKVQYVGGDNSYNLALYACGKQLLYTKDYKKDIFYDLDGNAYPASEKDVKSQLIGQEMKVVQGGYAYYIGGKGNKVYRQNIKTGKKSAIAIFQKNIRSVDVCGEHLIAKVEGKFWNNYATYYVSAGSRRKVKLADWTVEV